MILISMRTFYAGFVFSIIVCLIVLALLWWQNRKRSPDIALWLIGYIIEFIALFLIALRGILPDAISIVLADVLIIGGTIVLYIGLGRYVERQSGQIHNYVMLLVFILVELYFTYIHNNLFSRIVALSVALIYICAQGSWLMLRRVDRRIRQATMATGIVFAILCVAGVIQIIAVLFIYPRLKDLFFPGFYAVVLVIIYQLLFIALPFALFILDSRRLAGELEGTLLQRIKAEEELLKSEEKFSMAFQTSPYAICITRMEDGKFIEVNEAFIRLTGYSREELLADSSLGLRLWVNEKDREEVIAILRQGQPVFNKEYLFRIKSGEILTGLYSAQAIRLSDEPCLLSSIDDITESKRAEEQIKYLATHDALTDLPTMRLAEDRYASALSLAHRYRVRSALMFIDLDGFKDVNDTFGHSAGDEVLKAVAQRLLSCVRETDTVARVGGDEFLIIVTEIHTPDNASQIAEKIIEQIAKPFAVEGTSVALTTSIGIALFPDQGEKMDEIIKLADNAMYQVKNSGKNGFRFVNQQ